MKKGLLLLVSFLSLSFVQGQSQRMVFFEEFSQASCPACATSNPHLDSLLLSNANKALFIKYETSWPGADPMNAQNPAENAARVSYYGISGDPDIYMDGIDYSDPANVTQAVIDNEYGVPSPFTLQLSWWMNGTNDSLFVSCAITCTQNIKLVKPVLQIALLEKTISFSSAPGTNGEKVFYHIMRALFPDANGTALDGTWISGQVKTISYKEKIPSYIYMQSGMAITAWLQDNGNRSVQQASYSASPGSPFTSPPVAAFSANDTASCNGIVQFRDQSALFPSYWQWDFGDSVTSTIQNPVHQYTHSGTYNVKLKAGNVNGSETVAKNAFVHITFTGTAPAVINGTRCGPGTVTLSATAASGGILDWYDTTGTLVNTGTAYSPVITGSKRYYVTEEIPFPVSNTGPPDTTSGTGDFYTANTIHGLYFNVISSCTLLSVQCYANSAGNRTILVLDSTKHTADSVVLNLAAGINTVNLNFSLPAGNGYFIKLATGSMVNLYRNTTGVAYPYTGNNITITGNDASASYYLYFYNWQTRRLPCLSESATVTGKDTCLAAGIQEQKQYSFLNVFPDPGNGLFSIEFSTTETAGCKIQILNANGQIVFEEKQSSFTGVLQKNINLSAFPQGLYLLNISGNGYCETKKLLLK